MLNGYLMRSITILTAASLAISITGCKKKKEPVYELVALTQDELTPGNYYAKSGEQYFALAQGTRNWSKENPTKDTKFIWFKDDDVMIPTIYQDDKLIFVAEDSTVPPEYAFDRFEDEGYTIGVRGLFQNGAGQYTFVKDNDHVYPGSSFAGHVAEIKDGEEAVLDRIGQDPLSQVTKGGTVSGLSIGQSYNADVFLGTKAISGTVTADVHALTGFETYQTAEYQLNPAGYAEVVIPAYFRSGYYTVNDSGVFRYVAGPRAQGASNVNYNDPYYLTDEHGNTITADEYAQMVSQSGAEDGETSENIYTVTTNFDSTQEGITVEVKYTDPSDMGNAGEGQVNLANILQPRAKLTAPDGAEYEFVYSDRQENTLECPLDAVVQSGDWKITLYNMDNRTFDVRTSLKSGYADTFVHKGSGQGSVGYYLDKALYDGYFTVTWENADHAAKVIITNPNNDKFGGSVDPKDLVSQSYGAQTIDVGPAPAGTYKISVDGDDLGRIRITHKENGSGLDSDFEEEGGDEAPEDAGGSEESLSDETPEEDSGSVNDSESSSGEISLSNVNNGD